MAEPRQEPRQESRQESRRATGGVTVLAVGAHGDVGAVFAALSAAYTVHAEPARTLRWTWLDTADARLRRAGLALREERAGRTRDLVLDRPDEPAVHTPLHGTRWPARLDGMPASPVRDAVSATVGVRALLPVADVEARRIPLRVLDEVGKTRVRLSVDQQRLLAPRRAALPLHVTVRALRGYERDGRRCVELLEAALGAETTLPSPTDAALAATDRRPDAAGAVVISATDPAVRPVAAALLDVVAAVEDAREGAIADHDTEFLHDLRAAIRTTRALLAAAGHLLLGRSAVRVERDLAWLDEMTTPLRAVDIALLGLAPGSDLGVDDLPGLDVLRDGLQGRRTRELRRMRSTLRAPRAPATFTTWRRGLLEMVDADVIGPSAAEAAASLVADTHRHLVSADDERLGLRVEAMRAVLAAFAPLLTADADRVADDLGRLDELVRARDRVRLVRAQVREVADRPGLGVPAVLTAGAVLDRAARQETALDERIAAARADLTGRKAQRRVAGLVLP